MTFVKVLNSRKWIYGIRPSKYLEFAWANSLYSLRRIPGLRKNVSLKQTNRRLWHPFSSLPWFLFDIFCNFAIDTIVTQTSLLTMIILHTADWHLGQMLYGHERTHEHRLFLKWLLHQIIDIKPDLLLISGDVFDSSNPSASATQLYYEFLASVAQLSFRPQVIITAGNHDAPARLEAPQGLLSRMDISVRGIVRKNEMGEVDLDYLTLPLRGGGYCLAVPYIRQGDYHRDDGYIKGVCDLYHRLVEALPKEAYPIIAMGHMHVLGGEELSDDRSERLLLGGLDAVPVSAFSDKITYTALGHLHRRQAIKGANNIVYSGAPLPMSFSEESYRQGIEYIEITHEGVHSQQLCYCSPMSLITIGPHSKTEVLQRISTLEDGDIGELSPLLRVRISLSEPEPALRSELERALEGKAIRLAIAEAELPKEVNSENKDSRSWEKLKEVTEIDVAEMLYRQYYNDPMPEAMKALLIEAINEVHEEKEL